MRADSALAPPISLGGARSISALRVASRAQYRTLNDF